MQIKNVRFIIAAITTFSAYAVYVSRVNLSIAIIAMVEDRHTASEQHRLINSTTLDGQQVTSTSPLHSDANERLARLEDNNNNNLSATTTGAENNRTLLDAVVSSSNATATAAKHPEKHVNMYLTSNKSLKTPLISQEKFHWDQTEQGHILGAFFYGYILFQIPGARMAESVGAKWIIMAASAGSAVISLVFPLSTQLNSIHLLMVLRFVMGLCQSAFFPAAYVLFCRWLPERERSVLLPIMFIGSNMGSISTYILSSYLISSQYGWPSVFYLSGLVCSLCSLLWCAFGSNGPDDNWLISLGERQFIERNVNNQSSESNSLSSLEATGAAKADLGESNLFAELSNNNKLVAAGGGCGDQLLDHNNNNNRKKKLLLSPSEERGAAAAAAVVDLNNNSLLLPPFDHQNNHNQQVQVSLNSTTPTTTTKLKQQTREPPEEPSWPKLLKSMPVWVLILSMYGNEWSNVVLCYELPTYLNTALNFPIEQNGVINSFFQLSYAVASPIMSSLGAYLLDSHLFNMHKIHVRKLFQSLATFGQLACFVSVPICGANRGLIIMFMFLGVVFRSCANAGDIMVPGDLSPEYAGTIFAFANSIGNTAGFFVPLLAGVFVENAYQRDHWTPFWLTTAAIMGCSGLIFLIFGQTRRQDFSREDSDVMSTGESEHRTGTGGVKLTKKQVATATAAQLELCDQFELEKRRKHNNNSNSNSNNLLNARNKLT